MKRTILIAGATGFIGSHLVERLLDDNHSLIILKRSFDQIDRIKKFSEKLKFYDTDKIGLDEIFKENKIDLVINLVTNFGRGQDSMPSSIVDTNLTYGLRLVEAAIKGKAGYFLSVDSSLDPKVNLYAYTKKIFKSILKDFMKGQIKILNLQLEYVYGENDDLSKFIPMAISKLEQGLDLEMSGGEQNLDFVYVRDCVDGFAYLINNLSENQPDFSEYEIGSGETIMLKDFIEKIKNKLNSNSKITLGAVPYRQNEQMYSRADIKTLGGWRPKFTMDQALNNVLKLK